MDFVKYQKFESKDTSVKLWLLPMFYPELLCGRFAWQHIVTPLLFCAHIFVYFLYSAILLFKWRYFIL